MYCLDRVMLARAVAADSVAPAPAVAAAHTPAKRNVPPPSLLSTRP